MINEQTALATLEAALAFKLLGPSAAYFGEKTRSYLEKIGEINVGRIFNHAITLLGPNIDDKGEVPSKVLKSIIQEGVFCEDELTTAYFGGVLASSRSSNPQNDMGVTYSSLLGRLSTYQIRSHYIFCQMFMKCFGTEKINFGMEEERLKMKLFVPFEIYSVAMDFKPMNFWEYQTIIEHVLLGLLNENLIGRNYGYGKRADLDEKLKCGLPEDFNGFLVTPSGMCAELFLWAHGRSELRTANFISYQNTFPIREDIIISDGYVGHFG